MDTESSASEMSSPFDSFPEPLSSPEPFVLSDSVSDLKTRYVSMVALQATGMRLAASLDWDSVLSRAIESALDLFKADGVSIILARENSSELYIAKSHHLSPLVSQTRCIRCDEGVIGWVAQHHQPLLLTSNFQVSRYGSVPNENISSSMVVPIFLSLHHGKRILFGVLTISRHIGKAFYSAGDIEVANIFCAQVALGLNNAQHYRYAQRRVAQTQSLSEISRALISTLNVDEVLRTLMLKAVELLHCESGSLLLIDEATRELVFKVAVGPASQKLVDRRLPMTVGIVGAVATSGKPLIVNDAKSDPRHYDNVDAATELTTRTLLCVPLINKQRILGVIEVVNRASGRLFDEDDLQLLSAYAAQGTIALENAQLYSQLKHSFTDTVRVIANAVEARDPYTAGHTLRVTRYAIETARELGWTEQQMEWVEIGALLHDIGKVGISDFILRKPSHLTREEYNEMKQHPIVGVKMLEGVAALRPILPYILYHQEHYDGSGYPFGLAKDEIPIEGRLLAVVDTFDAMTSDRPYRKGLSDQAAVDEIRRNRGTQFDPEVADAFIRIKDRELGFRSASSVEPGDSHG
jgi:putative nucleotidyltransferase with HDIG domain